MIINKNMSKDTEKRKLEKTEEKTDTGAKVIGTKIAAAQTAIAEMTKCRTGYRQNRGTETSLSVLCINFTIVNP
uniref:Uncharacterized protein n=1 Tax=Romanomermis culicivorax TaxID=13658 RepID=A0A915J0I9_ROMCU